MNVKCFFVRPLTTSTIRREVRKVINKNSNRTQIEKSESIYDNTYESQNQTIESNDDVKNVQ